MKTINETKLQIARDASRPSDLTVNDATMRVIELLLRQPELFQQAMKQAQQSDMKAFRDAQKMAIANVVARYSSLSLSTLDKVNFRAVSHYAKEALMPD